MKLKVGDRVRVTDKMKYGNEWYIGKVGSIVGIEDDGDFYIRFDINHSGMWFSESELEYE